MAQGFVKASNINQWKGIQNFDNYLRGELKKQKENGIVKTENDLYTSFHCNRDNFTKTSMAYMEMYREQDLKRKAYVYTVSFAHDDEEKNGLTPQKAHEMSMQFAEKYFKNYPTLAVTHIDTNNLHTQIIVANVNVENGKSWQENNKLMNEMKKSWGEILEKNGMTESVKALKNAEEKRERAEQETKRQGKKVYPEKEYHKTMSERKINERGKATDKQLVGYYIHQAVDEKKVTSIEELKNELGKQEINVAERGKSFVFHYTDVKGKEQRVRDTNLAKSLEDENLKREEIEKRIQENAELNKQKFLNKNDDEQDKEYEKWRLINQRNGECLNLHKEVEKYDDKLLEAKKEQNKINDTDKSILEARSQQDKEREAKLMAEKEELVRAKEDIRKQLEDISVRYAEIEKRINDINKELDKNYPDDPKVKEIQKEKNEKLNEREFKRVYGETNAKLEMSPTGARGRVTEAGAEASNIQRSTQQQEQKQTEAEKPKNRVVPHM